MFCFRNIYADVKGVLIVIIVKFYSASVFQESFFCLCPLQQESERVYFVIFNSPLFSSWSGEVLVDNFHSCSLFILRRVLRSFTALSVALCGDPQPALFVNKHS